MTIWRVLGCAVGEFIHVKSCTRGPRICYQSKPWEISEINPISSCYPSLHSLDKKQQVPAFLSLWQTVDTVVEWTQGYWEIECQAVCQRLQVEKTHKLNNFGMKDLAFRLDSPAAKCSGELQYLKIGGFCVSLKLEVKWVQKSKF